MTVPQPFQYQSSKRALAPLILNYLPVKYRRLVDSFAGSAAMTLACAARMQAERYWINDLNKPLADLLNLMISEGMFNQSPDKRRLSTRPETMRQNIMAVSMLLRGRTVVTSHDFRDVLTGA